MTRQTARHLLLPKDWPRRVRSAIVHAISLARVTFTTTRGQAIPANSSRVHIERLQLEILLLKEEMRLKDARVDRIPAQRRPHYLPTERSRSSSCARPVAGLGPKPPAGCFSLTPPSRPG